MKERPQLSAAEGLMILVFVIVVLFAFGVLGCQVEVRPG